MKLKTAGYLVTVYLFSRNELVMYKALLTFWSVSTVSYGGSIGSLVFKWVYLFIYHQFFLAVENEWSNGQLEKVHLSILTKCLQSSVAAAGVR